MIRTELNIATIALLAVIATGCGLVSPQALHVEAFAEQAVASPEAPALITVTATNVGESRVTWGPGSSTCQLGLIVRVGGGDHHATAERICTADTRTFVLEPGESRSEVLEWDGQAQVDGEVVRLEPGDYELRGVAPPVGTSAPVVITLRADGQETP
jgi:hypothetical protein